MDGWPCCAQDNELKPERQQLTVMFLHNADRVQHPHRPDQYVGTDLTRNIVVVIRYGRWQGANACPHIFMCAYTCMHTHVQIVLLNDLLPYLNKQKQKVKELEALADSGGIELEKIEDAGTLVPAITGIDLGKMVP